VTPPTGAPADKANGPPPSAPTTILVVDNDAVARRYLEVSLAGSRKYRVEVAADATAALAVLANTMVSLIVSEITLPDMDGTRFLWRVRQDRRLRSIPFICLSTDDKVARRVTALELGARDYIVKWPAVTELVARFESAVRDAAEARRQFATRRAYLSGDFAGLSFADLINQLNVGRRTGKLAVATSRAGGHIDFVEGAIWHAEYGNIQGPDAIYELMAAGEGQFEFMPGQETERERRTVSMSPTGLLMEAARRMDMNRLTEGAQPITPIGTAPIAPSQNLTLVDPGPLAIETATEFARLLDDPFALGELSLLTKTQVADRADLGGNMRFHAVLITDLALGASILSAMASPLGETQLAAALSTEPKVLNLWYELRQGEVLDILLVDEQAPGPWLASLVRRPSAVVIAPSTGDWQAWPLENRLAVTNLVRSLRPHCIVGIGNAGIRANLDSLLKLASSSNLPTQIVETPIDSPDTDLRAALNEALETVRKAAGVTA
jgi:DNA-binding response OmpR family regulator